MAEHTPTPWMVVDRTEFMSANDQMATGYGIIGDTNLLGPKTDQQAADTEHIVRCVNSFDELVAALEILAFAIEHANALSGPVLLHSECDFILKTLARARGEASDAQS